MGWLRNILGAVANGFAWIANWSVTLWNLICQLLTRLWARTLIIVAGIIGFAYGVIQLWSTVIQPVRQWFMDGASAGFSTGDWGFSNLVSDWVGAVNYIFPLDEALQYGLFLFNIILGVSLVLAIIRLIKTIIGGWI